MAQRGQSKEKLQERLSGQESWISKLNQEADGLKVRLQHVEESKVALSNNRQFREAQETYEKQISGLENDKVSLMKRLNMVLSELEKATHEKSEINAKMIEQERMAEELKKKLEEVSSLKNVVNRNLQEDLRYERELNDKLRDEMVKFEKEKDQLIQRLKEQEEISTEIQRETNAINANLQRKSDELRRLERDHENNMLRLKELNTQLDSLRLQDSHSKTEKHRMTDELDSLTYERNELIRRMTELSDKYEDYVNTMNRERQEILRANQQHVKLLTAKLLFQILNEAVMLRRKKAFSEMRYTTDHIQNMEKVLFKFARNIGTYGVDRKRFYLRLWYRNSMDFMHELYKKNNLIEFNIRKKNKLKWYYKWRQAFLNKKKHYDKKVDGLKVMRILIEGKKDLNIRKYLSKWRDFVQLRQVQFDFMSSVSHRKRARMMRSGFVTWLGFTKKRGLEERYDRMSEMITSMWFKQRVFLALRQATLESKTEQSIMKFKAWKSWCEKARKNKYFDRKKLLVDKLDGTRHERLVRQTFDAIKYSAINDKYEKTRNQLAQEIPVRQNLEYQRDTLVKMSAQKDKHRLFRQACIRMADAKFRALQVWKENVAYINEVMRKIKLRLIEEHRRRISHYFFKWKEGIDKKHVVEMVGFTEELMNENQNLQNEVSAQRKEKQKFADQSGRTQVGKLDRIKNMLNRNMLRKRFLQWKENSEFVGGLEDAVWKTSKTIRKRKLKNAFNKFKVKTKEVKREAYIQTKTEWFALLRNTQSLDIVVDAWKAYVKKWKKAKRWLTRGIKTVDTTIKNDAFEKWKDMVNSSKKMVFMSNIEELESRQAEHEEQIKDLNKQIQENDCTQKHLESKLHQQSQKIMANFISRSIHYNQARGFYTWLENAKKTKRNQRYLKTVMTYWMRNQVGKGFRTWAEYTFKHKENELQTKLENKEMDRRNLVQLRDQEDRQQSQEVELMSQQLQEAKQLKDQLKMNYEKALETHIGRIKNNTYVDKRQNIFINWKDFIKKEKNAINVIGALTRKHLRMEVFSRIRLVARERFLDVNAEKVIGNYWRILRKRMLLNAFSKWRVNNYTNMVEEMEQRKQELGNLQEYQKMEIQNMDKVKRNKAERIIKQKKQRELGNAWIQMTKVLKALRLKSEIMRLNVKYMQQRWAVKKWHERTKRTVILRRRDNQVIKKYQSITLRKCFNALIQRKQAEKLLFTRSAKFVKRLQYMDLAHAFQQIVYFKVSLDQRTKEQKDHGNKTIYNTLNRLIKRKMADTLLTLKMRTQKREFKENFMRKVFSHQMVYRMRHYFEKWKHQNERFNLADQINSEGDVVLERNQMKRNVKALKDFLQQNGYTESEIEDYMKKKGQTQRNNMHKAIVGFYFKNSDFKIVPKAFHQWKRWIHARKIMRQWAMFVQNGLKNPLFFYFRKWKYSDEQGLNQLKDLSKNELVDKIITDELAIGSAESRAQRMNEAIDHLSIQRDSLLQHFISGQKLALSLGKNNYTKSMFRAFIKWKRMTKIYEIERLAEQLQRTELMINDLMHHVGKLEQINRNMMIENEELRQAALDGIEIAKAVQELTKEREQLSVDLQDRASTIKKLIEDNNNLSLRLSIAQKEAEQLEQLNQQSYLAQPERDGY